MNKSISIWLFLCAFMVMIIIAIGGYTRLQGAGLSIVEWKPASGVLLPSNEQAWKEEFKKYQNFPEYKQKNYNILFSEFKRIYMIEYAHRLIGRATGFIFLVPFIFFAVNRKISYAQGKSFTLIFLLGAFQGLLGWYMVRSGLSQDPNVSQYRLVMHLLVAILIYSLLIWKGMSFYSSTVQAMPPSRTLKYFYLLAVLVVSQIAFGGLLAGLDGGLVYNTFPLMNAKFIPDGVLHFTPWYLNFFENIATIQFMHRIIAFVIVFYVIYLYWQVKSNRLESLRPYMRVLIILVATQCILGIFTLIKLVPTHLALMHQVCAIILFTNLLFILHRLTYTKI